MIEDDFIVQTTPIITDEEIETLEKIEFVAVRGKASGSSEQKLNFYTANDTEFVAYLERITKIKKGKLLAGMDTEEGWTNTNRIPRRLMLVEKFKEILTPTKKKESADEGIESLTRVKFNVTKGKYPNTQIEERNLYTASDYEFVHYISRATKTKKEKLLESIDIKHGWNDKNRLPIRLSLVKRFQRSIASFQKIVDK